MLFFLSDQIRVFLVIERVFYVYEEKLELYSPNVPSRPEFQAGETPCILLDASSVGGGLNHRI